MNTEYFQHLYVHGKFNLLLDLSTIKKGYIVLVEYTERWGDSLYPTYSLEFYSYNTEDEDMIEKTDVKKIELIIEKYCYDNICKGYIHKNSDDIKTVIIKVNNQFSFSKKFFDIRYGKTERYIPQTILYSFIIGISLSLPNFLVQIIQCSREEDKKCHYKLTLFMDFLLHIGHGCLFSVLFYLGGKTSLIICYCFYGGYGFLFIINICICLQNIPSIFIGFKCLIRKFKNYKTFNEVLNENKKLPPKIILSNNEKYYEYDANNFEYEYCSWEDSTFLF